MHRTLHFIHNKMHHIYTYERKEKIVNLRHKHL